MPRFIASMAKQTGTRYARPFMVTIDAPTKPLAVRAARTHAKNQKVRFGDLWRDEPLIRVTRSTQMVQGPSGWQTLKEE